MVFSEAIALLRKLEWIAIPDCDESYIGCPCCNGYKPDEPCNAYLNGDKYSTKGHSKDCELARLIGQLSCPPRPTERELHDAKSDAEWRIRQSYNELMINYGYTTREAVDDPCGRCSNGRTISAADVMNGTFRTSDCAYCNGTGVNPMAINSTRER